MMDSVNTPRPTTRTLAVIDGGLNVKARVHRLHPVRSPSFWNKSGTPFEPGTIVIGRRKLTFIGSNGLFFFHNKRYPLEMAEPEIAQFLSGLATEGRVSASTQNQAFNAILFLYKEVLSKKSGLIDGVVCPKRPLRLPVVLTKEEVKKVIDRMNNTPRLMAILLYGGGLQLMECCRLRVKDIDFSRNEIVIRAGKGDKDRHTMLPSAIKESLYKHIEANRSQHQEDINKGLGRVALPNALERKYPNAGRDWAWQWVFPAPQHYTG